MFLYARTEEKVRRVAARGAYIQEYFKWSGPGGDSITSCSIPRLANRSTSRGSSPIVTLIFSEPRSIKQGKGARLLGRLSEQPGASFGSLKCVKCQLVFDFAE